MTDQTAQEPTMEEILASIRRIISEDDAPAETAPARSEPAEALPEPVVASELADETSEAAEPERPAEDDILELTEAYEAPAAESIGDLDVTAAEDDQHPDPFPSARLSESAFAPDPIEVDTPEHPSTPAPGYDSLVGDSAAVSAAAAFAGLASSLKKPEPMETSTPAGPTLDELARSLLRPMLKEWLDANLPAIVETQVRKEVERIARNAG